VSPLIPIPAFPQTYGAVLRPQVRVVARLLAALLHALLREQACSLPSEAGESVRGNLSRCCGRGKNGGSRKYGHYRMVGLAGSAPPSDEISPYD